MIVGRRDVLVCQEGTGADLERMVSSREVSALSTSPKEAMPAAERTLTPLSPMPSNCRKTVAVPSHCCETVRSQWHAIPAKTDNLTALALRERRLDATA